MLKAKLPKNINAYVEEERLEEYDDQQPTPKVIIPSLLNEDELWYVDEDTLTYLITTAKRKGKIDKNCVYTNAQIAKMTILEWLEPLFNPYLNNTTLSELMKNVVVGRIVVVPKTNDELKQLIEITYVVCAQYINIDQEETQGRRITLVKDKSDIMLMLIEWIRLLMNA